MNYKEDKLDIIVVAGQSNADGNGISKDSRFETRNDVYELIDFNNYWIDYSKPNQPILKLTLPVQCKVQCLQEHFIETDPKCDFSMSFVDCYKKSKFYSPERKIMVVKAAFGGTGFSLKQWGLGYDLYQRLTDMVDLALSFNPENRIVAFLWHQGEHDAYEQISLTPKQRYDFYYDHFMAQTSDFIHRYQKFNFPVIVGEFCNEWADKEENKARTKAVEKALKDCMVELHGGYVKTNGLTSNNQEIHNGDDIHFSKKAVKKLGKRYFKEFEKLAK